MQTIYKIIFGIIVTASLALNVYFLKKEEVIDDSKNIKLNSQIDSLTTVNKTISFKVDSLQHSIDTTSKKIIYIKNEKNKNNGIINVYNDAQIDSFFAKYFISKNIH